MLINNVCDDNGKFFYATRKKTFSHIHAHNIAFITFMLFFHMLFSFLPKIRQLSCKPYPKEIILANC